MRSELLDLRHSYCSRYCLISFFETLDYSSVPILYNLQMIFSYIGNFDVVPKDGVEIFQNFNYIYKCNG